MSAKTLTERVVVIGALCRAADCIMQLKAKDHIPYRNGTEAVQDTNTSEQSVGEQPDTEYVV